MRITPIHGSVITPLLWPCAGVGQRVVSAVTEWRVATLVTLLTGKAFITMAYNIAYLYGSEIFPTQVRNVGIGVAAVMEDVGAFVAPLIAGPLVFGLRPLSH